MAHIISRRAIPNIARFTAPHAISRNIAPRSLSHTSKRTFHASSPRHFNPIEPIISGTSSLLQAAHIVLPWYVVLPLAAAGVRLALLPITLYTRRLLAKQIIITPLVHAWRHALRRGLFRAPTAARLTPATLTNTEMKLTRKKQRELFAQYKCQSWRNFLPLPAQIGAFLVMVESIRGLIGAKSGLLGMAMGKDAIVQAPEVITNAGEAIEKAVAGTASSLITADPAMTSEGMLWFTDLTAADPQLILPFMLSGVILANTLPKHILTGKPAPPPVPKSKLQQGLSNFTKIFALAIGPLTLSLPSGLLLYWISSSTLALVQSLVLDIWKPLPKGVKPCKPPSNRLAEQIKVKKVESPVRDTLLARLRASRGQ